MAADRPSPPTRDELVAALRERLAGESDVAVAYLFGSHARGTSRPGSDVDVAVLLRDEPSPTRRLELADSVGRAVAPLRADVVVLNGAPVVLAYRVLRDGVRLVSNDEVARVRHWVATVDRYLDMRPMRETLAAGTSNRIREGRLGRP